MGCRSEICAVFFRRISQMVSLRCACVGAVAPFSPTLGRCVRCISTCWGGSVPTDGVLFDNLIERDDVTGGSQATTSASMLRAPLTNWDSGTVVPDCQRSPECGGLYVDNMDVVPSGMGVYCTRIL